MKDRLRQTGALLAAGLLLAACVPRLERPPPAISAVAVPVPASAPASTAPWVSRWWTRFQRPQLEALIDQALAHNPGLAEARSRVLAAQAVVDQVDARRSLRADGDGKLSRLHNSRNGDRAIYNGRSYWLAALNLLSLDYHLDLWGEDRERTAIAVAQAEAAEGRQAQAELLLTAAVIKTYFAWQTADRLSRDGEARLSLAADAARIQTAAVRFGIAPVSEQVRTAAAVDAAGAQRAALDQQRDALRQALLALLGRTPDAALTLDAGDSALPVTVALPPRIDLDQLSMRPDIRVALAAVRATGHAQALAVTAYYPNVDLHAMLGFTSIGLSDLLQMNSLGFTAGPAIHLPLFEGGALDAHLHQQAARHAAAIEHYNQTVLEAAARLATDLSGLEHDRQSLQDRESARAAADRLAAIAEAGFRSGVSDRYVLVQAQLGQLDADQAYQSQALNWLDRITDTATDLGGRLPDDEQKAKN